jgi:ATP-dependent DNA ligase
MQNIRFPPTSVPSDLSARVRLAVVSSTDRPPDGLGWLHEVKHDGHRLAAILDGDGGLKLITRKGNDRTSLCSSSNCRR